MITVYGINPRDRSGRVRWMLHEVGQPFEDHWIDWRGVEPDTPAFRAISPLGKVPAIVTGDTHLCETSTILDWIGRTYGQGSLDPSSHDDNTYRSWLAMASSTVDPLCFEFVRPDVPRELRPPRREQAQRDLNRAVFPALESVLDERETMLPGGFSAVDIQVAASLHYADVDGRLADRDRVRAWLDAQRARPAAAASGLFG